jgi:hypothetical protein
MDMLQRVFARVSLVDARARALSAFIVVRDITHVMDVWTIWSPDHALQALIKSVNAGISIVDVVLSKPPQLADWRGGLAKCRCGADF